MPIERRPIVDRDQWLAWRREDVTASVVPALFDAHPYVTALRLYMEKRGIAFDDQDNKSMRRGRWLEPAVGEAVRELRSDWKIEPAKIYFREPQLRLGATPDFFIAGDPRGHGVLQAKTVAPSVWHRDWHDGSDPPLWVRLQCLTECMLTEAAFGAIAVMLVDAFAMDVEIVEIARNPAAEAKIVAAVRQFWADVENDVQPQPDYGKDAELIKALSPIAVPGKTIDLAGNNELADALVRRVDLLAAIRIAKDECTRIETQLKHVMGDAELLTGLDGWQITYRNQPRKAYTVPAGNPRVLHIHDRRPEEE